MCVITGSSSRVLWTRSWTSAKFLEVWRLPACLCRWIFWGPLWGLWTQELLIHGREWELQTISKNRLL